MTAGSPAVWAVVPAAGVGSRFGGELPKQYLPLAGRTVIEWALRPLIARDDIQGVIVALSPSDRHWARLGLADGRIVITDGGDTRAESVRHALESIGERAGHDDWVLVHDAVRPCLTDADLDALIRAVAADGRGGILAAPVQDTIKQSADCRVERTLERECLWRALTPQMFRYGELLPALGSCGIAIEAITDESVAMERAGVRALLVRGRADNIKITRPEDLPLAGFLLENAGID
jgi:2-C-methyl-D-erythritol 4-phosphate cytidylyltransferase